MELILTLAKKQERCTSNELVALINPCFLFTQSEGFLQITNSNFLTLEPQSFQMIYKQTFFIALLFNLCFFCQAQHLSKIIFKISDFTAGIKVVELSINNVILTIDENGTISSVNCITGGDFDYWTGSYANDKQGKVKSVGSIEVDYWTGSYAENKQGKVKSIGNIEVDYWTGSYAENKQGKVKSIGNIEIDYWTGSYANNKQGKVKSIGNIEIDYWTGSYATDKLSKVKSIGNIEIDYWTGSYATDKVGKLKSITGNSPTVYALKD